MTLSSHESRTIFDYNSADWKNLYKELSANFTQSSSLLGSSSNCSSNSKNVDIDVAWQKWNESFINTVSRHIPTKVVKRRGSPPWFDSEIRHLFKRKETARRKAKKSSRPNHWENFRNLRRSLKSLVARKKREFLQPLPNLMKSNLKKLWSVFKSISRTSSVPNKMVWTRDDITTTAEKPTEVANLLNDYFYYMFKVPLSTDEYNNCSTQDEILCELQFGFLTGKSTTDQLLQVLHEIGEMFDKRIQTDIVYLDFAKAFDRVDHQLLLKKLKNFGISGNLLQWFKNYLTNRHQKVTVLGQSSQPLPFLSGVPQGSILGPLLFLIYVNDLPQATSKSSVALYADDIKCFRSIKNV